MEDAYTKLRYTDTRYTYKIHIQDTDTRKEQRRIEEKEWRMILRNMRKEE